MKSDVKKKIGGGSKNATQARAIVSGVNEVRA